MGNSKLKNQNIPNYKASWWEICMFILALKSTTKTSKLCSHSAFSLSHQTNVYLIFPLTFPYFFVSEPLSKLWWCALMVSPSIGTIFQWKQFPLHPTYVLLSHVYFQHQGQWEHYLFFPLRNMSSSLHFSGRLISQLDVKTIPIFFAQMFKPLQPVALRAKNTTWLASPSFGIFYTWWVDVLCYM
jgi:hypothetical protein